MALQTKVNGSLVPGVVGEFSDGSPKTARAYLCYGTTGDNAELPTFGRLFSFAEKNIDSGSSDTKTCAVMGIASGAKQMGILVNPKEHYIVGFATGRTLADDGIAGTIATQGHIWVMVESDVTAGAAVYCTASTGKLSAVSSGNTQVKGAQWLRTVAADFVSEYSAWEASHEYSIGDKVYNTVSGVTTYYVCSEAHTSSTAIDTSKFTVASPVAEALAEVAIDNPGLEL